MRHLGMLAILLLIFSVSPLMADTISFSGMSIGQDIPSPYMDFTWSGWAYIDGSFGFGYQNLATATGLPGMAWIYGDNGSTIEGVFSRPDKPFILQTAVLGAAWRQGVTAHIQGYLDGVLTGEIFALVNDGSEGTAVPTIIQPNWLVDEVRIQGTGGTSGYGGILYPNLVQSHVLLSSIDYAEPELEHMPEPSSILLLGGGLGALGLLTYRRRNK